LRCVSNCCFWLVKAGPTRDDVAVGVKMFLFALKRYGSQPGLRVPYVSKHVLTKIFETLAKTWTRMFALESFTDVMKELFCKGEVG
jgi:hypothetical protein